MEHKTQSKPPECHCVEKLEEWYKFSLFGGVIHTVGDSVDKQEVWGACLGYMIRRLSRRQIPRMELVQDTLTGKLPVPPCGFIGCAWDSEHVH